jgi:hypothetical protein
MTGLVLPDRLTLPVAHELLHRDWPGMDAPAAAWVAHYQRAAEVYRRVAEVDLDHHPEALFWAADARASARRIVGKDGGHDDRG